ncbi:RNA recognition motif-containing protein 10 [Elsinoe australis]|uniref:RNA recognition motif-containing protein 10 n=1 Tax=Elsinoe australis TaxID=40998 RepID=A0A4U7B5D7_9PEZI|nr:RNA recognition motif-containing protein 10 [Elsinoe australis]
MNGDNYSSRGSRQGSGRDYSSRDDRRGGDRDRDRGDRPRRRSRSPHGGRSRDFDVDSYSSSRGYRDREREDRYGGGGGRDRRGGDRDWDRGGYGGRRDRRDDGPRGGGRDRDLMDDRRGGGRRGGDDFPRQQRRSASPPKKPKEPTPDLTDIVPVTERRRRLTQWDIKPPGYENISAEQAKLSGMFPLPGAPRQQAMDLSRLQAFMKEPANAATGAALDPSNSRQAKRMVVYNIPSSATDEQVRDFFNLQLNGLNVVQGRDPCVSAHVSKDRSFALLEFRNAEDATLSLALDGLEMDESHANGTNGEAKGLDSGLQIKRPKDYIAPSKSEDTEVIEGQTSSTVPDTPNKVCLTRVPIFIDEDQVKELVSAFGALKSYVLVKDADSGSSRGVAFCEYVDAAGITDTAIESLNGMELGDSKIKLFRACVGASQVSSEMNVNAMSMLAGTESSDVEASRVLCLYNMVTADELIDNDEYEEICEDIKDECSKYGEILELKIPRPSGGSRQANGVGKIYLKYDSKDSSTKALRALAGRRFADRTVVTSYFGEEYFDVNAW